MDEELKQHLLAREVWLRGLFIVIFALIYSVAKFLIVAVVVFQFISSLVTGKPNLQLLKFSQSLSTFVYEILTYMTFNSNTKPYPFSAWPKGAPITESRGTTARSKKKTANKKQKTEQDKSE